MELAEFCQAHLELMGDWWWIRDFETDRLVVSDSVQQSLGYRPEQLSTTLQWAEIIHPDDLQDVQSTIELAEEIDGPTEVRIRFITRGGKTRTMLMRMRPWQVDGVSVGMIGVAREIDDILAIEDEIVQRNADLVQVASIISHDFRGPVRHVSQCTDRVLDVVGKLEAGGQRGWMVSAPTVAELRKWAEMASSSALRLGKMIEHVLQYSRAGTNGIQPEDIDSAYVVEDVLRDYSDRIDAVHATIRCRSLPKVHYDPTMLYLLLANLIGNAIKFSKKDDPEPVVEIDGRHTVGEVAAIAVRDNGIGFPPGQAEKILQMGFRLHHESDYSGFGYGLAIVKRILSRCGGQLGVRSKVGEGSEFVLKLPAARLVHP